MTLIDDRTKELIDTLADCAAKCEACARDCSKRGNADLVDCIALCLDCGDLCQICLPLLARGSQFAAAICSVCADASELCAAECERVGMTECAEVCRTTAEICREMAGAS